MISYPTLIVARDKRVADGHPWLYSNELAPSPELQQIAAGSLVRLTNATGRFLGLATYNPKTLIAGRILSRDADEIIDTKFFERRIEAALALRGRLFDKPFYRLIHAEADGLPATIVDRYGDVLAVQTNSAGAEALQPMLLEALAKVLQPRAILLKNDSGARTQEGLGEEVRLAHGALDAPVIVEENGARFPVDLLSGQKTGWFFDQRDNRAFMAGLARDAARVLDVYTYAGGFAVQAALAGAKQVIAVDRSEPALELVTKAASLNSVDRQISTRRGDAFKVLEEQSQAKENYDAVILDPPAFIKSRKDMNSGLRAYGKLARLGASLVKPGGFVFIASCSHNAGLGDFAEAVARGLTEAKRSGRILRYAGAGPDHPVHPLLPESAYLKAMTLQLD